jgi:hypothetical protein
MEVNPPDRIPGQPELSLVMKPHPRLARPGRPPARAVGLLALLLLAARTWAQLTPAEISDIRNKITDRIEAATIMGGDFGMSGASFTRGSKGNLSLTKFGGWGDIGDPQPLGNLPIGWQPQLQGEMGYLTAEKKFKASDTIGTNSLDGAKSKFHDFSIQFGGGPRLWFNEHFSVAPTIMGMYGHTEQTLYTNSNAFAAGVQPEAKQLGLADYTVDTWTIRPSADFEYVFTWRRILFTLNSTPTYFHTESFSASNPNIDINGNSWTWLNKIDVDIPLGRALWGHELRTGGYFSRTELMGDIKDGMNLDHLYELHGRLVLDYLNQLWKVQWIGIGGSYLWGNGGSSGFSIGLDVAFQF